MKRISEKLKSSRGASMIFALLVFLLCVLAGTAALTAASANIGRYTHLEDEQRQYFSVASALEILQGKVSGDKGKVEVTVVYEDTDVWKYVDGNGDGIFDSSELKHAQTQAFTTYPNVNTLTYFQTLLLRDGGYVPSEWGSISAWTTLLGKMAVSTWTDKEYTVELDSSVTEDWAESIYPVTVKVQRDPAADAKFNLVMYLSTKDGDAYPLKVEWPGTVEVTTDTTVTTEGNPGADTGTRTTTTTVTITLTWSEEDRQITFGKAS